MDDSPEWGVAMLALSLMLALDIVMAYWIYKLVVNRRALHIANVGCCQRSSCESIDQPTSR